MNEFEHDPNEKSLDVPHAATGFIASFVFFLVIYVIGAVIAQMTM
ncbi:MAG TPA: YqzM family protein [Pseudogracilibacillus sp.]|nr:YqzM family protein [Pseudogracilibacillus sp.]